MYGYNLYNRKGGVNMNLTEVYQRSMKEVLENCNIVEQKLHTDDKGNIQSIELKYVPKESEVFKDTPESRFKKLT